MRTYKIEKNEDNYVLTLSKDMVRAIKILLSGVGGLAVNTVRKHVDSLYKKIEDHPDFYLDTYNYEFFSDYFFNTVTGNGTFEICASVDSIFSPSLETSPYISKFYNLVMTQDELNVLCMLVSNIAGRTEKNSIRHYTDLVCDLIYEYCPSDYRFAASVFFGLNKDDDIVAIGDFDQVQNRSTTIGYIIVDGSIIEIGADHQFHWAAYSKNGKSHNVIVFDSKNSLWFCREIYSTYEEAVAALTKEGNHET